MKCRCSSQPFRPLRIWRSKSGEGSPRALPEGCCICTKYGCTKHRISTSITSGTKSMANTPIAHLTRRYEFAASHRLHSNRLSEEENQRVYGKCNNPYGHGHNYHLEVTVSGPIDAATGMVMNVVDLDAIVQAQVLDPFDHSN